MNFSRAEDDAAEAAALAVDVLGGRIDHAVGAELQRALVERRREHVVDDQRRAGRVRDLGDRAMSITSSVGIGRRLEEEGLGVRPHRRRAIASRSVPSTSVEVDAEARQAVLDDVAAGAEQRLRRDDVVAGLELAHQRGGDRRHAGRGRARGLGAFERRHALLEHRRRSGWRSASRGSPAPRS